MARLNSTANSTVREYLEATTVAVAFVLCMPFIAIGAFLVRGLMAGAIILVLVFAGAIALWHWAEPRLTTACRAVVRDVAVGTALLAGIPIIAVVAVTLGGVVAILLPIVAVALGVVGVWRIIGAGRHIFTTHH